MARFASAHWCAHHRADGLAPDPLARLRSLATDGELWSLAADAGAPPYIRSRAVHALSSGALDGGARARLAAWAGDSSQPRPVRAAALRALADAGAPLPAVGGDAVLARIVQRLR